MIDTKKLFDEEFRKNLERARRMTPEERILESLRLSDLAANEAKERVRREMPGATEKEINDELRIRSDELHRAKMLGFTVINGRLKMRGDPPT